MSFQHQMYRTSCRNARHVYPSDKDLCPVIVPSRPWQAMHRFVIASACMSGKASIGSNLKIWSL